MKYFNVLKSGMFVTEMFCVHTFIFVNMVMQLNVKMKLLHVLSVSKHVVPSYSLVCFSLFDFNSCTINMFGNKAFERKTRN